MIQRRTLASGSVLGLALLSSLTLAGVMSAGQTPQPAAAPSPSRSTLDTHTAAQPRLRDALITPADLPTPYVQASKATVLRVSPTPVLERCTVLLNPRALLTDGTDSASATLDGPTQVSQVLTTFAGDGAAATMHELRSIARTCRTFNAELDDGRPVTVSTTVVRDDGEIYSLRLELAGGGQTISGYLTLGRVGQVLSVLTELGPAEALDPLRLVDLTLKRLTRKR